ncbi:MAG: tRNA (adenosine(37)-N6)-threonylcarbamoyltransferase complex transferase subunit TsaD [Phycisphaerae bacterium]
MSCVLGIETTCDETACAIVRDGRKVRSNVVRTQIDLHQKYGGVVPEIAARAHIEWLNDIVAEAMRRAAVGPADITGIGVANCPGLIGCLLVGVSAAKALAFAWDKPLLGVNHVHAHLYASCLIPPEDISDQPSLPHDSPPLPALGLVISGGHTTLYAVESFQALQRLGSTIDDAVGEAFDKVAAILQLGYPGGPLVETLARRGHADAVKFPLSLLGKESLDFSFSGLKTAVLYHVNGARGTQRTSADLSPQQRADTAAAFLRTVVEILEIKVRRALEISHPKSLIVGGGVSANQAVREALQRVADRAGIPLFLPVMAYCTDNAAMIAGLAAELLAHGQQADLDLSVIATA